MAPPVQLTAVQVTHLRGFVNARLDLTSGFLLLVGPNNSGKTSVLRLLDWVLNEATEETLLGDCALTAPELDLLLPARETRNAARRLTLLVRVTDGRRHTRFKCESGVASLRIGVLMPGVLRMNLGRPRRGEGTDRGVPVELLREHTSFSFVPAARDASSANFVSAFQAAVGEKLGDRMIHRTHGGATTQARAVKRALGEIQRLTDELVKPLWGELASRLPSGMARSGAIGAALTPDALVEWIAAQTELRVVTGAHDAATVPIAELGSGLQSLLELALHRVRSDSDPDDTNHYVLAIEEPEAFLHPSAQRTLARMLSEGSKLTRIVSTHSHILVDETKHSEVVLIRNHKFYPPGRIADERRQAINTSLLTGQRAELAFAQAVLLVEGPGDRLFYERLRRRLGVEFRDGRIDQLVVLEVGGKTEFRPWLELLRSYGTEADRPIRWLVLADGDAAEDVMQAHTEAGDPLRGATLSALEALVALDGDATDAERIEAARAVNRASTREQSRVAISPIDLEQTMLGGCSDATAAAVSETLGLSATDRASLVAQLGAKKAVRMRATLADTLPWADVSEDTIAVLRRWLAGSTPRWSERSLAVRFRALRTT